jgi:hypothetical protein
MGTRCYYSKVCLWFLLRQVVFCLIFINFFNSNVSSEILGSHSGEYEDSLLGYSAM